jgi:ABC-2 type transport system ATP-binding protein
MLWFCGGHGACLTSKPDADRLSTAAVAWLRKWVAGDTAIDTGARFEFVDQNGVRYSADDYPLPAGAPLQATGSGTLVLTADGGAGPVTPPTESTADLIRPLVLPVTPSKAANAVNVPIPEPNGPALLVGAPQLELTYRGTASAGDRPTRAFAQLVDERTGLAVGNQITPIPLTLDDASHTLTVPLEVIAYAATPESRLTLQLVATTVAYAEPRLGGSVDFERIRVNVPTVTAATPQPR